MNQDARMMLLNALLAIGLGRTARDYQTFMMCIFAINMLVNRYVDTRELMEKVSQSTNKPQRFNESEWKKSFSKYEGQGFVPIAPHCQDCTRTREYCYLYGHSYPYCSDEPNREERMRLYP